MHHTQHTPRHGRIAPQSTSPERDFQKAGKHSGTGTLPGSLTLPRFGTATHFHRELKPQCRQRYCGGASPVAAAGWLCGLRCTVPGSGLSEEREGEGARQARGLRAWLPPRATGAQTVVTVVAVLLRAHPSAEHAAAEAKETRGRMRGCDGWDAAVTRGTYKHGRVRRGAQNKRGSDAGVEVASTVPEYDTHGQCTHTALLKGVGVEFG